MCWAARCRFPSGCLDHGRCLEKWVAAGAAAGEVVVDEPLLVGGDEQPHRWIEIRSDEGRLITVIEVLSPANKNQHRAAYVAKRANYVAAGVSLTE